MPDAGSPESIFHKFLRRLRRKRKAQATQWIRDASLWSSKPLPPVCLDSSQRINLGRGQWRNHVEAHVWASVKSKTFIAMRMRCKV